MLTAMAFNTFMRRGCRLAVIEVGLGGRYDATTSSLSCRSLRVSTSSTPPFLDPPMPTSLGKKPGSSAAAFLP